MPAPPAAAIIDANPIPGPVRKSQANRARVPPNASPRCAWTERAAAVPAQARANRAMPAQPVKVPEPVPIFKAAKTHSINARKLAKHLVTSTEPVLAMVHVEIGHREPPVRRLNALAKRFTSRGNATAAEAARAQPVLAAPIPAMETGPEKAVAPAAPTIPTAPPETTVIKWWAVMAWGPAWTTRLNSTGNPALEIIAGVLQDNALMDFAVPRPAAGAVSHVSGPIPVCRTVFVATSLRALPSIPTTNAPPTSEPATPAIARWLVEWVYANNTPPEQCAGLIPVLAMMLI